MARTVQVDSKLTDIFWTHGVHTSVLAHGIIKKVDIRRRIFLNYYKFIVYPLVSASSHISRIQNPTSYAQDIQVFIKPTKRASSMYGKGNFPWN
jgi:hypothetical protein